MSDNKHVRFVELERGTIDLKTGEFPMVLATDGEASDGDILSIEGAEFKSRAPLQLSHVNDPRDTLGTVSGFRRDLKSTPKKLRAKGQIEMTGEGPTAEIRRDLAHMISQGHVSGISVRWEPIKYAPRARLGKDHPAFVGENETDSRKRYGTFHEKWRVLEGSVVAVQADHEAMIGRAEQTEGAVSTFWRAMAEDAAPQPPVEPVEEEIAVEDVTEPPVEPLAEAEPEAELAPEDEPEVVEDEPRIESPDDLDTRLSALEQQLAALDQHRNNGEAVPPIRSANDLLTAFDEKIQTAMQRVEVAVLAAIKARQGIVTLLSVAHDDARKLFEDSVSQSSTQDYLVDRFERMVEGVRQRVNS